MVTENKINEIKPKLQDGHSNISKQKIKEKKNKRNLALVVTGERLSIDLYCESSRFEPKVHA